LYGCTSLVLAKEKRQTGYTQHQAVIKMWLLIKNGSPKVEIPQWCLDQIDKYNNRLSSEGGGRLWR